MKDSEVLVKVSDPGRLLEAWQQVRKNAGAAGRPSPGAIHDKLESGTYRFQPARRVLIPKEGTSGMRKLGIPVLMDRIVGASMHSVLEEIFDPQFTASNFGFRRGRSQHQAIRHLQRLVKEGREWAVAIDLKSFFDEISYAAKWLVRSYPDIAAKVYRALGMRILNAKKSKYYDGALSHFEQAKRCYRKAGQELEWNTLVDTIRRDHRRKSAFMPGFK